MELGIRVTESELGIVENRRESVIQLVANRARKDAQAADALQVNDSPPQSI